MASTDKNWAEDYVNGPLTAPDPSDETGPGSHLRPGPESPVSTIPSGTSPSARDPRRLSKSNPFRNEHGVAKEASASVSATDKTYPSPPPSASPHKTHSPRTSLGHRQEFLGAAHESRPRRSSSLKERFPGDPSVNPLDQLAREKAKADRARHVTKKHAIRPDTIDDLDSTSLGHYHHEGPYDATLYARNNSWKSSPVAAVAASNSEALKATPHEKIVDAVQRHHPLDGVAAYPPGMMDRNGQTYQYQEGDNMMIEENAGGGPYKRWPGLQYHPDDIKGKGEPSYTIEKALKEHSPTEKEGTEGVEMTNQSYSRTASGNHRSDFLARDESGMRRSSSLTDKLRQRVGSLKKKVKSDD